MQRRQAMPERPYFNDSTDTLAARAERAKADPVELQIIAYELSHRNRSPARALLKKIHTHLENTGRQAVPPHDDGTAEPPDRATAVPTDRDTPVTQHSCVPVAWSPRQKAVIERPEGTCLVVEAGPGTGKTATACARVAHLVEEHGLSPSSILLISFTRTAVREIRDRIEAFASERANVAGLRILTLDSFTWQVVKGLSEVPTTELLQSYEGNIRAFTSLLKEHNAGVIAFLSELEHVLVDEGQDLVGDRADLCLELIKCLPKQCGVTVFADSAQAIYGFTDDTGTHGSRRELTVVERIIDNELKGFVTEQLNEVHRTKDTALRRLFTEGRNRLLNSQESDLESWRTTAQFIRDNSHGVAAAPWEESLEGRADRLILYRTRAEVLMASAQLWKKGRAHTLRMSGTTERIHPWIGRIFASVQEEHINRHAFGQLWDRLVSDGGVSIDDAWKLLRDYAGDRSGRIQLIRLREILSRTRPPVDFVVPEGNISGPIVGTIHASKGREADIVNLMVPSDTFLASTTERAVSPREIAEEERVLFVGATRARQRLNVGSGMNLFASKLDSGRVFRPTRKFPNAKQVEIGLKSDVDRAYLASCARTAAVIENDQNFLWESRSAAVELESRYDPATKQNLLSAAGCSDPPRFALSKELTSDLFGIARRTGYRRPGSEIKNIWMLGASTCVIPTDQRDAMLPPWRSSGFLLMPVISGFTLVFFNR
jgi:hypothetical protein